MLKTQEDRKNIYEFYGIRAIAAIAVIAIHASSTYVGDLSAAVYVNQISRFALPLFIIISGFLLYNSDRNNQRNAFEFWFKRVRRVLVPYLIWTYIYCGIGPMLKDGMYYTPQFSREFWDSYRDSLLSGRGSDHLYFILIILQLYIIYPVIAWCIDNIPEITLFVSFLISFYFQLGTNLINFMQHYNDGIASIFPTSITDYNTRVFFAWLFYFALGIYYSKNWYKLQFLSLAETFIMWVLSLSFLIIEMLTEMMLTTNVYSSIKVTIMLYSIFSFFFFFKLFGKIRNEFVNSCIRWIANQSFVIYFIHVGILIYFRRAWFSDLWIGEAGMWLLFLSTTVVAIIATLIISYLPFSWVLGAGKRRSGKKKLSNFFADAAENL